MNANLRRTLLTAGIIIAATFMASAQDVTPKTMRRAFDPIQVPGELLTGLQGARLDSMRLLTYKDGSMQPVIYQFDERLPDGTYIFDMGEEENSEKHNHALDPQDFLVFRVKEAGDRAPKSAWPSQEGIEIELRDPVDNGKAWVYLLKFEGTPPARNETDTATLEHWDPWKRPELPFIVNGLTYRIEGRVNKFGDKYYKTAVNEDYRMPKSAGGADINILDGQKMRAFMELFFGKIRIEKDESSMIGGIDSLRHGYVRGYGRQWLTVKLPMDLKAARIYSDVFTYESIIVSPMELNIPFNPESILTKAGIEFGYDLNEAAYGMRFYSPNCMDGVTIDGKMTEKEKAISNDWVPWYLITGPQASLIFRVDIEKKLMEQTDSHLTYIDDLNTAFPPEKVPGSIGYQRTTIEITSVKPGKYLFRIEWYFPPNFYKPGGYDKQMLQDFLNIKDAPVVIAVGSKTAENHSLDPPPLIPSQD